MRGEDTQLDQAFSVLDIFTVAKHFGHELKPGVQKSPLREDKNGQSFSVYQCQGKYTKWKDHANGEGGGVWHYVKEAAPDFSGQQIRNLLVELSGQDPKQLTRGQVKREVAEKRKDLYKDQRKKVKDIPPITGAVPGPWSVPIRTRFEDGKGVLAGLADDVAATRGWDARVILDLLASGKTSSVLLPWDRGRSWAWTVEKPVPKKGTGGRSLDLVPVGYHGRYKYRNPDKTFKKMWHYVPAIPSDKKADGTPKKLTEFQAHLLALKSKTPAYPFVIGDLCNPRLVIILEGQFDAVSFAEAFGWLENGFPPGVSVFGLRGVQSQVPFLAAYGFWLKKSRPAVWLIGDNDAAGRKVSLEKYSPNIVKESIPFIDRLAHFSSRVYPEVITSEGIKDFNDIYKRERPTVEEMHRWAADRGFKEIVSNGV